MRNWISYELFSGQHGFGLAQELMGKGGPALFCEIDEFVAQIGKYYWPNAIYHNDIKTLTQTHPAHEPVDLICGGFPCQPYSSAGKREGKADERHLWPYMLESIRTYRPTWVVGENVPGLITWNAGEVFEEVCRDLEAEGYTVLPVVLSAAGEGAPHVRKRIFFVARRMDSPSIYAAYANHNGWDRAQNRCRHREGIDHRPTGQETALQFAGCGDPATGICGDAANAPCIENNRGRQGVFYAIASGLVIEGDVANPDGLRGGEGHELQQPEIPEQFCQSGDVTNANDLGREWAGTSRQNAGLADSHCADVANAASLRLQKWGETYFSSDSPQTGTGKDGEPQRFGNNGDAADPAGLGQEQREPEGEGLWQKPETGYSITNPRVLAALGSRPQDYRNPAGQLWDSFPTVSPLCAGDDGIPARLDAAAVFAGTRKNPLKASAKKKYVRWRQQSIKAGGNAVVPQVVLRIFQAIEAFELDLLNNQP